MSLVRKALNQIGRMDLQKKFNEEGITDDVLPQLSEDHMRELGICDIGSRLRMTSFIRQETEKQKSEETEAATQSGKVADLVRSARATSHAFEKEVSKRFAPYTPLTGTSYSKKHLTLQRKGIKKATELEPAKGTKETTMLLKLLQPGRKSLENMSTIVYTTCSFSEGSSNDVIRMDILRALTKTKKVERAAKPEDLCIFVRSGETKVLIPAVLNNGYAGLKPFSRSGLFVQLRAADLYCDQYDCNSTSEESGNEEDSGKTANIQRSSETSQKLPAGGVVSPSADRSLSNEDFENFHRSSSSIAGDIQDINEENLENFLRSLSPVAGEKTDSSTPSVIIDSRSPYPGVPSTLTILRKSDILRKQALNISEGSSEPKQEAHDSHEENSEHVHSEEQPSQGKSPCDTEAGFNNKNRLPQQKQRSHEHNKSSSTCKDDPDRRREHSSYRSRESRSRKEISGSSHGERGHRSKDRRSRDRDGKRSSRHTSRRRSHRVPTPAVDPNSPRPGEVQQHALLRDALTNGRR